MDSVLKGFSDSINRTTSGPMPLDAANVIAQTRRRAHLLEEVFKTQARESIFQGVPRDAAVNLYNIELKKTRENDLYSFY